MMPFPNYFCHPGRYQKIGVEWERWLQNWCGFLCRKRFWPEYCLPCISFAWLLHSEMLRTVSSVPQQKNWKAITSGATACGDKRSGRDLWVEERRHEGEVGTKSGPEVGFLFYIWQWWKTWQTKEQLSKRSNILDFCRTDGKIHVWVDQKMNWELL